MVYYRVAFNEEARENASSANYGAPTITGIGLPEAFYNDGKRFVKVFVEQAFITGEIPNTVNGSHLCIQLTNPMPSNQVQALNNGYTSCGELGMAGKFDTAQSGSITFRYERSSDLAYAVFSKDQFAGIATFNFRFLVDGDGTALLEQPSLTKERVYHVILGMETFDQIQ